MIGPFIEGVAQSLLPCSWIVVLPAVLVGMGTRRINVLATFGVTVVGVAWLAVAGWLAPPVWAAGLGFLLGAVAWWRHGPGVISAVALGVGAAWAWQPCVGEELSHVLNTAQVDPWGALPGLVAFMTGLLLVGLGLGVVIGLVARRPTDQAPVRVSATLVGLLGISMLIGIYSSVASVFARWSTALWT